MRFADSPGRRILEIGGKSLHLPAYVPSFSEFHIGEPQVGRIWRHFREALRDAALPVIMLSIFDLLYGPRMSLLAKKAIEGGASLLDVLGLSQDTVLFLDSGGLEWSEYPSQEFSAEKSYVAGRMFLGDIITLLDFPGPHGGTDARSKELEIARTFGRIHKGHGAIAAVAHGSPLQKLTDAVHGIAGLTGVEVVCVTRKELGRNLDARAAAIHTLRVAAGDKVLHVLAEGTPRVWLGLANSGADSFDATSWARGLFVPSTFHRLDRWNAPASVCDCSHCRGEPMNRACRTVTSGILHNWALFNDVMNSIRERLGTNQV